MIVLFEKTSRPKIFGFFALTAFLVACSALPSKALAQGALETPLRQDVLTLLTNEISGQIAFNNLVKLAGAPWIRDHADLTEDFYESHEIFDMVRAYGIETVRLDEYPRDRTFSYPTEGEFWIVEPEPRLVARLGADVAMIASGSQSADLTGELIYIPPISAEAIERMAGAHGSFEGKVALMWSHPRGELFEALDAAGLSGVVAFNARERYLDPNQVVYSRGNYASGDNLSVGLTVSWRQWTELLEDVERGIDLVVRVHTRLVEVPDRFETVFAWIPGIEPDEEGVIFTGHLFEGYTKRGTNDNMGAPAIQLEILRALNHLIETGEIERPRRTIYFLWPNEISGTYEFIRREEGLLDRLSINVNMDMVSENLRLNNSWFTMSETPAHLPSYLDGLSKSILNYVWRTNDIVYLPDSPRGRPGGQYFPRPMWEKNGSGDAFRFYIHEATGGSDHICFNNSSVAIPAIEFFTWPDQWYHADADLPDKGDPTEMKRVAFIGAAVALAAADLTDERLPRLIDAVSEFGYARVADRGLPRAMRLIEGADEESLQESFEGALNVVSMAVAREVGALESIREMYSGTRDAANAVDNRVSQWEMYEEGLLAQVMGYAALKAGTIGIPAPSQVTATEEETRYASVVPAIHPDVFGSVFYLNDSETYRAYLSENPEIFDEIGPDRRQTRTILNYINGQRSVTEIRNQASAASGSRLTIGQVNEYLQFLADVGWIVWRN